jgi:two-component system, NtrC family, response regulator AtoC
MERILVVEEHDPLRQVVVSVFSHQGFEVEGASDADAAFELLCHKRFDCVVSDYRLSRCTAADLMERIKEFGLDVPFVITTALPDFDIAVEMMKLGAKDIIRKPLDAEELGERVKEIIREHRGSAYGCGSRADRKREFLTENPRMTNLLKSAARVAEVDSSVLLLGESGTGKELLARYIHEQSNRRDKPFVAVNCAAIPEELLESEFFGHEIGAFTGASQTKPGVFEIASEGTIFLDEIGDMPLLLQVKLLRTLQEQEVKRVGGTRTIKVSPRIISATNHIVSEALDNKTLREDLYYRLAVVELRIPPLRERPEDIDMLADYYIDYFSSKFDRTAPNLTPAARATMKNYLWPGNARELENVIERALVLCGPEINPEHLGINLMVDFALLEEATVTLSAIAGDAARKAEEEMILRALSQTQGNKTQAAKLLGVSYKTLLNKVKEYESLGER